MHSEPHSVRAPVQLHSGAGAPVQQHRRQRVTGHQRQGACEAPVVASPPRSRCRHLLSRAHAWWWTRASPLRASSRPQLWDVRKRHEFITFKGHSKVINCLRFSPDGRWVASGAGDGAVKVRRLRAAVVCGCPVTVPCSRCTCRVCCDSTVGVGGAPDLGPDSWQAHAHVRIS